MIFTIDRNDNQLVKASYNETNQLNLQLKDNDGLIILCELDKDENGQPVPRQDLYGIALAQKLRQEGFRLPIIFTSFLSRRQVYDGKIEREIINTIGHSFVQLPCRAQDLIDEVDKIKATLTDNEFRSVAGQLSDLELYDIQNNYCRRSGIAQQKLHSLNGLKHNNIKDFDGLKKELIEALSNIFTLYNEPVASVESTFNEQYATLNQGNFQEAVTYIEYVCGDLISRKSTDNHSNQILTASNKWSLLLLDDEISSDSELVKELTNRQIKVHCARTVPEAKNILEQDARNQNSITLVVADYRLNDDVNGVKIQQPVQGYSFLKELSSTRRHLKLAALSSLPRKFLIESFKHYGVRVDVFPKKDFMGKKETLSILCDELIMLGEENFLAMARLPKFASDGWCLFEPFYLYHRNSVNYIQNESYVTLKAKSYCDEIKHNPQNYPFSLKGYTVKLEGKSKVPEKEKAFQEFLEKMVCRRVALWYSRHAKTESPAEIHKIIKGNDYKGVETETAAKNQINTNLALAVSEFQNNLTIEEFNWLIYEMGMTEVEAIERQEQSLMDICTPAVEQWFSAHKAYAAFTEDYSPNTFGRIKTLMNQVAVRLIKDRGVLDSFQKLTTSLKATFVKQVPITSERSRTVTLMYNYLVLLSKHNRRVAKLPVATELADTDLEDIKQRAIELAKKKIPDSRESSMAIESIAELEFYDLAQKGESFSNINQYVDILVKAYKEQEYIDPKNKSLDSLKKRSRFEEDEFDLNEDGDW